MRRLGKDDNGRRVRSRNKAKAPNPKLKRILLFDEKLNINCSKLINNRAESTAVGHAF